MTDKIPEVKLRNGTVEAEPLVLTVTMALRRMLREHPIALFELISLCRDRNHKLFGNAEEMIQKSGLMDTNGHIHESIRNIVVCSSEPNGIDMSLVNPITGE